MTPTRRPRHLAALAVLAAFSLPITASTARAEEGMALDRFDPAPAGDRLFATPSPTVPGNGVLHLHLLGTYAYNPLVLTHAKGQPDVGAVVSDQLIVHAAATYALASRVSFSLDLPFAAYQAGDDPTSETTSFASPTSSAMGDLRIGARFALLGKPNDLFQVSLAGSLWLPTGDELAYTSDGGVRGMPQLILGGTSDRVLWSFAAGAELRGERTFDDASIGSLIRGNLGFAVRMGEERKVSLGPELASYVSTADTRKKNTNLELLLAARYRLNDVVEVGGGFGPGLSGGYGTPDVRGMLMLAYSPDLGPKDRDKDRVTDDKDQCPDEPVQGEADPKRPGCSRPAAPPDRDKDGIADAVDGCPDVLGVPHETPARNGCPSDRDNDGIADEKDACPDASGPASAEIVKNGCPLPTDNDGDGIPNTDDACPEIKGAAEAKGCPGDSDSDGVRDDLDACPDEKGVVDPDAAKNGCPTSVRVSGTNLTILEPVQFETGRAKIKAESDELIRQVAGVLKDHPEIVKLEVQGHTDNKGPRNANLTLSQQRADAVKAALIANGIAEDRLTAKGYGPDEPIMANLTEDGRSKNRRVEFKILERK